MTRQNRPLFAGSARCGSTELRLIMTGIWLFCGLGAISHLSLAAARFVDIVFAVLGSAAVVGLGVRAVRRELRIRHRLAAIKPFTPVEAAQRRPRYSGEQRGRAA